MLSKEENPEAPFLKLKVIKGLGQIYPDQKVFTRQRNSWTPLVVLGGESELLEKQRGLALHSRTQTSSSLWPMISFDLQGASWERAAECRELIDCFAGPGDIEQKANWLA